MAWPAPHISQATWKRFRAGCFHKLAEWQVAECARQERHQGWHNSWDEQEWKKWRSGRGTRGVEAKPASADRAQQAAHAKADTRGRLKELAGVLREAKTDKHESSADAAVDALLPNAVQALAEDADVGEEESSAQDPLYWERRDAKTLATLKA